MYNRVQVLKRMGASEAHRFVLGPEEAFHATTERDCETAVLVLGTLLLPALQLGDHVSDHRCSPLWENVLQFLEDHMHMADVPAHWHIEVTARCSEQSAGSRRMMAEFSTEQ